MSDVKNTIIIEAAKLILKKGVRASSVNEILENAKAGKGQFYHYFKNKEHLIQEVIKHYGCNVFQIHGESLEAVSSLKEFIQWIQTSFHLNSIEEQIVGCLLGVVVSEVAHENNDLKKHLVAVFDNWQQLILKKMELFIEQGVLIRETPCKELTSFLITTFEGGAMLSKLYQDKDFLTNSLKQYCILLQSYVAPRYRTSTC